MDAALIGRIEDEIERQDFIIRAAEEWHPNYRKDKDNFQRLVKVESRFERVLRGYFRELSQRISSYILWHEYENLRQSVHAARFDVDVIVDDGPLDAESDQLIKVIYDVVEDATLLGAQSAQQEGNIDIGLTQTSDFIQQVTRETVAQLVGKQVRDGIIIDNPRAKYRITDTLRKDIKSSISTSISLNESRDQAITRMKKVVSDPKRARLIARTEAVNAYQGSKLKFGIANGAVGKEWQSVNPLDICGTNEAAGVVPINKAFPSGAQAPTAHPNCGCSLRIVYPEDPEAGKLSSSHTLIFN